MPVVLPLIALVFWFDSYRTPLPCRRCGLRTFYILGQGHSLIDFAPFVAGVAAWMGSRDGRRGLTDLVTTSARSRFAAQFATWAATAIWAVAGYLVFMAATLWALSRPIVYGAPPYWPVAVGAVGVAAFSAAGFAAGAFFPTRFTAPVAAFGALLACGTSSQIGFQEGSGWALILPTNSNNNFGQDAGIFYQFLPDLPIARVMFLGGIAVALVAVLGLPVTAGGPRLRRAATVVAAAGAALTVTGDRPGHHRPGHGHRHCHPGAARRGQRPADPVYPGLRQGRDPGLRAARLPVLADRRDAGAAPGGSPDRRPAGRARPGPRRSPPCSLRRARVWARRRAAWARSRRSAASRRCSTCRWGR